MSFDEKSLVSSTREAAEMADLGPNTDQAKKKPSYYEGVYMNERTISTNGDVTPALLRSPLSRGLFHLPRYVPKYTINSRIYGNYSDDNTFSDSKTSRTFDRKYKDDKDVDSDYFREVPIYRDSPDETNNNKTKETKKTKGLKKSKKNAESEERKACCSKCSKCCSKECCTPKCRRCACIFFIVALVAAALLALALGLYFGYFMQFGDSYPMKANFTVTNATYREHLSDLSNPNTINLTNGICQAFKKTLENVSQVYVDLSSCSAINYTNGSVNAIFNIDVRHRREQFTNSGDAFPNAVSNRVTAEFRSDPTGYFAEAVSNSILSGYKTNIYFNVVLHEISSGHFSPSATPSISTVTATPTRPTTKPATKTSPKNIATSTGNNAGANTKGNATACGNNTAVSVGDNSTASGCGNDTSGATSPGGGISTATTPSVSATKCGNSTGVNSNTNETNCGNNTSVTAESVLNTTITSIAVKTTELGPTSAAKVSSTANLPSSIHTDSSTTMKTSSTNAIPPSSTQSPTIPPTSTKHRTTTLHPEVPTTATPSATTPAPHMRQATTSERITSESTSHAAQASSSR